MSEISSRPHIAIVNEIRKQYDLGSACIFTIRKAALMLLEAGFEDDDITANLPCVVRGFYFHKDDENHPNMDTAQSIAYYTAEGIVEHYEALKEERKHNKSTLWNNIHEENGIR